MRILKCGLVLMVPLLGQGCLPTVEMDDPITVSEAVIARFLPDTAQPCNSVLPFPSDLSRSAETGTLSGLPYCPSDSADTLALKTGLRTLDGFSLNTVIYTTFSAAIDPGTMAGNVLLYDTVGASVAITPVWNAEQQRIYIFPDAGRLSEGTRYTAVIKDGLKAENGDPIVSDQVFIMAKSLEPLTDDRGYSAWSAFDDATAFGVEGLRVAFEPMFRELEDAGIARENVLVAWSFTTQRVTTALSDLHLRISEEPAQFVADDSIAAADHPLLAAMGLPTTAMCDIHTGRVFMNSMLTDTGLIGADIHEVVADYILITPIDMTTGCTQPWNFQKVAVYAHGLGRCKNDVLAMANGLAAAGFAVLAFDGPRAGTRTLGSLGDQNLDGCQDQPATPELLALGSGNPNPFSVRDLLRQWAFEISQVVTRAKLEPGELIGAETTQDLMQVAVLGHSWGGIPVVLAGALNPEIDVIAVTATSGNLAGAFSPLLEAGIAAKLAMAGVDLGTSVGQTMLATSLAEAVAGYRWALEAGDPLYVVEAYPPAAELPVLVQVVSNVGADAPLHFTETQQALADAFGRPDVGTFTLACDDDGTPAAICDDATAVVGSMLVPCSEDPSYLMLAYNKTVMMQRQLISFVATNGACLGYFDGMSCTPIVDANEDCP